MAPSSSASLSSSPLLNKPSHHVEPQAAQQQQQIRSLNDRAVHLLKQGSCGAALDTWRVALDEMNSTQHEEIPYNYSSYVASPQQAQFYHHSYYSHYQDTIQSISVHPELIYQLSIAACPDVTFPLYCRAFLVQQETAAVPSVQQLQTSFFLFSLIDGSVVLYNMGLAYHLAALSNDARHRSQRLARAYSTYTTAEQSLTALFQLPGIEQHKSYCQLLVLALALCVNKGHIFSHLFKGMEVEQSRRRIEAIQKLLRSATRAEGRISQQDFHQLGQQQQRLSPQEEAYVSQIIFASIKVNQVLFSAPMA